MMTLNLVNSTPAQMAGVLMDAGLSRSLSLRLAGRYAVRAPARAEGKFSLDRVSVSWHLEGSSKTIRVEIEE